MEKSLTQLIEEMAQLKRIEDKILVRASKVDYHITILKTKKEKILKEAKAIENERRLLAKEYHLSKSRCPKVLIEAEKALGRPLTLIEIQKIELYYNEKVNGIKPKPLYKSNRRVEATSRLKIVTYGNK